MRYREYQILLIILVSLTVTSADVKTIMQNKGMALMGIGYADGEHRAVEAATNAISSPLLEDVTIDGATGIIINITGGSNLNIQEVNEATTLIMEAADEDAEIIFGTVIEEDLKDTVKVTVIATGLTNSETARAAREQQQKYDQQQEQQAKQQKSRPTVHTVSMPVSTATVELSPPTPNREMLANAAAFVRGEDESLPHQEETEALEMGEEPPMPEFEEPVYEFESLEAHQPHVEATTAVENDTTVEESEPEGAGELARARAIAQRLGITNLTDDEYDIPTYMRRQQDRDL